MSVNLLLSYFYHPKADLGRLRQDLVCGRLMIDSGAFSAWTIGEPVDRQAYAEFLERWSGKWDYAVTLDVIGDPDTTAVNTRWFHARGIAVLPVFTLGHTLADFDAMVADTGYVCVGGLVKLSRAARIKRVAMLQRRAQDHGGGVHALGVGSMTTVEAARPYSSDSSNTSSTFVYGTISIFDGHRVRMLQINDRKVLTRNRDIIRQHGIDLADLVANRMPKTRYALIQAMGVAYACADEYAKRIYPTPDFTANQVFTGDNGPHLYMSMRHEEDALAGAALDRLLHDDTAIKPRLWTGYGHTHQHTKRLALEPK